MNTQELTRSQDIAIDRLESVRLELYRDMEDEFNNLDKEIEHARKSFKASNSFHGKIEIQKQIAKMEVKRSVLRMIMFSREDLIDDEIDGRVKQVHERKE